MPLKSLHIALLVFLAVLQTVQGAFSGTTLCREESGEIVLEWSNGSDGRQCKAPVDEALPCINKSVSAASEHCQTCLDIPLPSDKSVKSLSHFSVDLRIPTASILPFVLAEPAQNFAALPAPSQNPAFEHLSSIRLLI